MIMGSPYEVWLNDEAGNFSNSGQSLGSSSSMCVALGDLDGNGDLDAFMGNYFGPDKVWLNNVQSAEILFNSLLDDVSALNLSQTIENSLTSKLENALKSLEKENDGAAINQLNAFINEVEAQSGKKIPSDDAGALIDKAHMIIGLITGDPGGGY